MQWVSALWTLHNFKKSVNTHSSTLEIMPNILHLITEAWKVFFPASVVRHFRATVDLHHHLPRLLVAIQGFGEYAEHLPMGYIANYLSNLSGLSNGSGTFRHTRLSSYSSSVAGSDISEPLSHPLITYPVGVVFWKYAKRFPKGYRKSAFRVVQPSWGGGISEGLSDPLHPLTCLSVATQVFWDHPFSLVRHRKLPFQLF